MENFESIVTFVFDTPLYEPLSLAESIPKVQLLLRKEYRVDGFCPWCRSLSTFRPSGRDHGYLSERLAKVGLADLDVCDVQLAIACSRRDEHKVEIWARIVEGAIVKLGQFPSLADITKAEAQRFTKVLEKQDANEFNRALGLAAHGIGIGSFVYLRRIFERMIDRRYAEAKDELGIDEEDFQKARMDDKVTMLRDHLPKFLVENRKIYGFLSLGVHELGEQECLGMFGVLRLSIEAVLEEAEAQRQIKAKQDELKKALQDLQQQQKENAAVANGSKSGG